MQVKSKKRVADHGEVFTNEREVNAMLDLVKDETERIDSRFLEPACGNGNFLAEVLRRKLNVVKGRYGKSQLEFERYAIIAVSSIYGVDILNDNAQECRERLYQIFDEYYSDLFKDKCKNECKRSVKFILDKNIICGDALTMMSNNDKPITFCEWESFNGCMLKRRDFQLNKLLENVEYDSTEFNLFSDINEPVFIPLPVKEYPPIHFLKLGENDTNEL